MEKTIQKTSSHTMMHELDPIIETFEYEPGYQDNGNYAASRLLVKGVKIGDDIEANDEYKHTDLSETGHAKDDNFSAGFVVKHICIQRDAKGEASGFDLAAWLHIKTDDYEKIGKYEKGMTAGVNIEFGDCNEVQIGKAVQVEEKDMGLCIDLSGSKGEPNKDLRGFITISDDFRDHQVPPRAENGCQWVFVTIQSFQFKGGTDIKACGRERHDSQVNLTAGNQGQ